MLATNESDEKDEDGECHGHPIGDLGLGVADLGEVCRFGHRWKEPSCLSGSKFQVWKLTSVGGKDGPPQYLRVSLGRANSTESPFPESQTKPLHQDLLVSAS